MEDLEIIRKVMDQHILVVDQLNSISTTMSDKDALYIVEKAQADLAVGF
jgi:hypothetical protein